MFKQKESSRNIGCVRLNSEFKGRSYRVYFILLQGVITTCWEICKPNNIDVVDDRRFVYISKALYIHIFISYTQSS